MAALKEVFRGSEEEEQEFSEALRRLRGEYAKKKGQRIYVPKLNYEGGEVPVSVQLVKELAEENLFVRKQSESVTNADLDVAWKALQHKADPDGSINYMQFCDCRDSLAETCEGKLDFLFSPSVFLGFPADKLGRISIDNFFDLIMQVVPKKEQRLDLYSYDVRGNGYIYERELEKYIRLERMPFFPALMELDDDHAAIYPTFAARKFMFFLDPHRSGRIKISDLLSSPIFDELGEMRRDDLPPSHVNQNWFSLHTFSRIYSSYIELDVDGNGLLSSSEFSAYAMGGLNREIVTRVFEICTNGREMDFKGYLDFVLATEYDKTAPALEYCFKLLDLDGKDEITPLAIAYFWKGIQEHESLGSNVPSYDIIFNEIVDMLHPADAHKIRRTEFLSSGCGHMAFGILSNVNSFVAYENREYNLQ